jgi:hypothetical protein
MTTFALIAGMLPVAIGMGDGGEFYRPMAVAIIGGTITSTILTLLVIPTFYDSIEIAKDHTIATFHERAVRWNPFKAFIVTFGEVVLALTLVRFAYRSTRRVYAWVRARLGRRGRAAPMPVQAQSPAAGGE